MAGERGSAQPAIAGASVDNADRFFMLDVSDTATSPNSGPGGTVKTVSATELANVPALAGALAYTDEQARDAIGAALAGTAPVTVTPNDGANTITIAVGDASATDKGVSELATAAETSTGTDAARTVTPDGLAGSIFGQEAVTVEVFPQATAVTTGDAKKTFRLPDHVNGMNLIGVGAAVFAKSTSGTPTIQIARGRCANATSAHTWADMLSTRITIDANEFDSKDASAAPAIDTSNDDIATGDLCRIDVDTAGTGTTGLFVTLRFQLP